MKIVKDGLALNVTKGAYMSTYKPLGYEPIEIPPANENAATGFPDGYQDMINALAEANAAIAERDNALAEANAAIAQLEEEITGLKKSNIERAKAGK